MKNVLESKSDLDIYRKYTELGKVMFKIKKNTNGVRNINFNEVLKKKLNSSLFFYPILFFACFK